MTDLRTLGEAMRDAQRAYFKDRSRETLIASKQSEVAFDKALAEPYADEIERLRDHISAQALDIATLGQMAGRAAAAEAKVAALREALQKLITHTLDCEQQLDEFHGLGNDAGSGMSSVVCDARAALATGGKDE